MTDPWMAEPRWWRLDPNSQVEVSWNHVEYDVFEYTRATPIRTDSQRSISLRAYRRNPPGWQPEIIHGPRQAYDTYPYRMADGTTVHGWTRIVDGIAHVYVHALDAPGLGDWTAVDVSEVLEQAA